MQDPGPTDREDAQVKILIADDEPHIRHLVGTKLKSAGYEVFVASNGQDCLTLAREHRPSLIVTDYQMPVLSGYDMSVALAADQDTADIPIILLTARGHKLTPEQIAATGIRMVIDKPFGPRDLMARVDQMLKTAA